MGKAEPKLHVASLSSREISWRPCHRPGLYGEVLKDSAVPDMATVSSDQPFNSLMGLGGGENYPS